jgi:predicted MFS family arabinose efflux permease
MASTQDIDMRTTAAMKGRWRLPVGAAFALQVSILLFFLAGSSAPTPLYALYQAEWGFSPITVTIVFGIYAVAVLTSLLIVGSLSDHIGRRPVLLVAVAVQAVTMLVFASAGGVPELLVARIIQGLATGAAVGAIGAGLLDLDKAKGTVANGVGALAGTATGALVSGLLVQYLPEPTHLIYLMLFAIFVLQGFGVALMAETSPPRPGALASLRLQVGLPAAARGPMLVAVPVLISIWALAGFYGSLGPSLVRTVVGSNSAVFGGLALFVLAGSAAVTIAFIREADSRTVMLGGIVALAVGVAITLVAIALRSPAVFFVGTAVAGVGFGGGFQGALRMILPLAAPHERAGVLSIVYVVSYVALGVPAVIGGVLAVHVGVLMAAREYGAVVIGLTTLAFLALVGRGRPAPQPTEVHVRTPAAPGRDARTLTANYSGGGLSRAQVTGLTESEDRVEDEAQENQSGRKTARLPV